MLDHNHRRDGIIWLASYPKSGSTWLRLQLDEYFEESGDPHDINKPGVTLDNASSRLLFEEYLGLDSSELHDDEAMELRPDLFRAIATFHQHRVWLKVHDAQHKLDDGRLLFPTESSACVVYIVRNPLDVVVSQAFHDGDAEMDRAIDMLCDPDAAISGGPGLQLRQVLTDWSSHVASWIDQSATPLVTVRYEDMLQDNFGILRSVVATALPDVAISEERLHNAVARTRFSKLQRIEQEQGFRERRPNQARFFRQGKAGGWRDYLTPDQVRHICSAHAPMMMRLGYLDVKGEPCSSEFDPERGAVSE